MNPDLLLTIHCDGRVTVGDKLKPEETAKLVLDIIKTQWLKDAQATKIRELNDLTKQLETTVKDLQEIIEYQRKKIDSLEYRVPIK
jgi:hypothetical protein